MNLYKKLICAAMTAAFCINVSAGVKIVAHRGFHPTYLGIPENSLESMKASQVLNCDGSEFDVWMTTDGEVVVWHNSSMYDAEGRKFKVQDRDFATIRNCRLSNGEPIPTLREMLIQGMKTPKMKLVCEFKTHRTREQNEKCIDKTLALVDSLGIAGQMVYIAFSYDNCKYLRKLRPDAQIQYLSGDAKEVKTPAECVADKIFGADYDAESFESYPDFIKEAHNLGMETNVWTVKPKDFDKWIDAGIDYITTNEPEELKARLAERKDWAQFYRYEKSNSEWQGKRPLAVLMGDSITANWAKMEPAFFKDNNMVGRGISGQVSSQMLSRFRKDVLDLNPKYVVILAGTNDIALNNGTISIENVLGNIQSMVELAKVHKIRPILCSVTPSTGFRWRKNVQPAETIKALNALIKEYAVANHIPYVDFWTALANEQSGLDENMAADGVHPTVAAYKIMEDCLMKVVK